MNNNFRNQTFGLQEVQYKKAYAYPYLFGESDEKPYGYETSLPKQMYLAQIKNSNKLNPLQSNY